MRIPSFHGPSTFNVEVAMSRKSRTNVKNADWEPFWNFIEPARDISQLRALSWLRFLGGLWGRFKNPKGSKISLGVQNLPRGSTFVLGWLYNFLLDFLKRVRTNRDELGRIAVTKKQVSFKTSDQTSRGRLTGRALVGFSPNQKSIEIHWEIIGSWLVDDW